MRGTAKCYDELRAYCERVPLVDCHDHSAACGPRHEDPIGVIVSDDPLLRERTRPDGLEASLRLESRQVRLPMRTAPTERERAQPQVVVMASGDLVPFEVRLERAGTQEIRAIIGGADGKLEILANDDVRRR